MTEQWRGLKETITEMRDNDGTGTQQDVCKFLVDYMEVLEKQMQQPCEDCISRQKALDCFEQTNTRQGAKYAIETLPSVTPQRPKGKWLHIYKSDIACECSVCHIQMPITEYYHYCPNCGAYMGGGEDGET